MAAVGWTNCHNSQKRVTRDEQEIWGANIVEWKIAGIKLKHTHEDFKRRTKVPLERSVITDQRFGQGIKELYNIDVEVKEKDQVAIACQVTCQQLSFPHIYD